MWADFVRTVDDLVMPIDGTLELRFLGNILRLGPGRVVLIPARASHAVRNAGGAIQHSASAGPAIAVPVVGVRA